MQVEKGDAISTERITMTAEQFREKFWTPAYPDGHPVLMAAEILRLEAENAKLREDKARLDKLSAWLERTHGSVGEPTLGSPGWELGFSAGMAYHIDGAGDTLREAIDSLPA